MNALFIQNQQVDYLVTAGGHYLAYLKESRKVVFNRFKPCEPNIIKFLKTKEPKYANVLIQGKQNSLDVLKSTAKVKFNIEDMNITTTSISSKDPDKFESLVAKLE